MTMYSSYMFAIFLIPGVLYSMTLSGVKQLKVQVYGVLFCIGEW